MRFFLDFKSDNSGKKQIDEPFGTSDINFSLKQKDNGMARDISFSGGDIQFEFTHLRNHELKQLLYYHAKYGFEAVVILTIEIDDNNKYNCDLDFATAETDGLEYFKCKGIQDGKLQLIKRRKNIKVDVLSGVDLDGNFIGGLVPENILLLAKPVIQSSEWEQTEPFFRNIQAIGVEAKATRYYHINPCVNLVKYGIEDSYTFFQTITETTENPTENDYKAFTAQNNLKKVNISITELLFNLVTDVDNGGNGYVEFNLEVRKGIDFRTATKSILIQKRLTEFQTYSHNSDVFLTIDSVDRGESVWIYFYVKIRQSAGVIPTNQRFECATTITSMKTDITAESIAYNSISKSLRLIDVMRQVVKSISGIQTNAPRFEALGQFYDNRLFNGNFLRGITDKPFYVSLEDIEKSLPEMHGDWEIGSDGKVFFGIEADYYTNTEIGFFNNTQFSSMNKTFNPKYKVNEFGFKYANYQSLKENEEPNSADEIHGESRFVFFNKSVENKKEVEVEWTRSAPLAEQTRRKALTITEETASQDDDTIFCMDSIDTTFDNQFTEVSSLSHTYDSGNNRLVIRNDGSINFLILGIEVGSTFIIQPIDLNSGSYTVFSVTESVLELTKNSGVLSGGANGIRETKYTYELSQTFVPFTNYTDQGFTETKGLNAADSYSNRRYSIKRNIYNYWKSYIATCNLYWKSKPLKNTWYKNNGDYTAKYAGIKLTEKADFVPDNPILSPVLYNDIVFANVEFEDFITLQNAMRSDRGFIRTIDNDLKVIKVYPIDIEYSLLEKELVIKAEEKFEATSLTISTEFKYVLINNETRVSSLLWEIKDEKLYITDENGYLLYNGVYWYEVSINGAIPSSKEILENWLSLVN